MMHLRVVLGFLFAFCFCSNKGKGQLLYQQSIIAVNLPDATYQQSLVDLKDCLEAATKKQFVLGSYVDQLQPGINLLLIDSKASEPQWQKLKKGSIEDFIIQGNNQRLLIIANHPLGLSRGIYTYLDKLGFRWYLPGQKWIFFPSLKSITLNEVEYHSPSFAQRDFFGTGAIIPLQDLDPGGQSAKDWEDWRRRNRIGTQIYLPGHYGEVFNQKHRKVLEANPAWLALVNGKRTWSEGAKWCISNRKLREFFIADRIEEAQRRSKERIYPNELIAVSVDPSDGAGHCECSDCAKMGSVSDRVFFLANETAKALDKVTTNVFVNLYAYNVHAAAPRFTLHPRLVVQVIPYAFQSVAKPEDLISQWRQKHSNLWIYSYYGIPDWQFDHPLSGPDALNRWLGMIRLWHRSGLKGFLLESSYSAVANGPGLYAMARLGWDINENPMLRLEEMYNLLFGSAAVPVKQFFTTINSNYAGPSDLPYLLSLISEADRLAKDQVVKERITLLKAYTHYLRLYAVHFTDRANTNAIEDIIQYVMQVYPYNILHSTRLADLMYMRHPNAPEAKQAWRIQAPLGSSIRSTKFLTLAQINRQFEENRKLLPLVPGFDYTRQRKALDFVVRNSKDTSRRAEDLLLLDIPETLVKPSESGNVTFFIKVNEGSVNNTHQQINISLIDTAKGTVIQEKGIKIDKNWLQVRFTNLGSGTYSLKIKNTNWVRINLPANQWMAFRTIPTYAEMGRLWTYNHAPAIFFTNLAKEQPVITPAQSTKPVEVKKLNELNLYQAGTQQQQWYTITQAQYKFLQFHGELLFFPDNNYILRPAK